MSISGGLAKETRAHPLKGHYTARKKNKEAAYARILIKNDLQDGNRCREVFVCCKKSREKRNTHECLLLGG